MNEYSQMVSNLAKPGADILKTLTPEMVHSLHMAIGISGEVAELKEHQLQSMKGGLIKDSSIIEELGDIEFYLEGFCQSMFITIEQTGTTLHNRLCLDKLVVITGELLDLIKKIVIYNKQVDIMLIVQILIKFRTVLDETYIYFNITKDQACKFNMDKLLKGDRARYKEGSYSDQAAQLRDDKETQH